MPRVAAAVTLAVALAAPSAPAIARAADAPTPESLRAAAAEFDLGDRAYQRRDYEVAAAHFEAAFQQAAHPDPLELAIKARIRAGTLPRAATLSAIALERYPERKELAALARGALEEARKKLHEVSLVCVPSCAMAIDGRLLWRDDVDRFRVYVEAGSHTVVASWTAPTRTRAATLNASAGMRDTLVLEAPPPPEPPRPVVLASTAPAPADAAPRRRRPLPPVVFFAGLGLTAAGVAATAVSAAVATSDPGADVVRERCRGLGATCPEYQAGEAAELRTNVLLVSTIAIAAATAVVGLFLTDY